MVTRFCPSAHYASRHEDTDVNKTWPPPRPRRNYSIAPESTRRGVGLGAAGDWRKEDQWLPEERGEGSSTGDI